MRLADPDRGYQQQCWATSWWPKNNCMISSNKFSVWRSLNISFSIMQCRWTCQIQFPVKCIISNQWFQFNTVGLCWWTSCCYQKGAGCKERKSIRNGAGEWSHNNKWLSIIGQCEVFTRKDILRWSEHCSAKISPLHNVNPLFYRTANWCQSLSWKTWRDYLLRSLILPSPP